MIYIVGTNHELQHTAPPWRAAPEKVQRTRQEFQTYLSTLAGLLEPQVIAEEFSQQALDNLSETHNIRVLSAVKAVADALDVEHRFCDPDVGERDRLGLSHSFLLDPCSECDNVRATRMRESYWLSRLADVIDVHVLFVCGAKHVQDFCDLAKSKGIDATVVDEYFGRDLYAPEANTVQPILAD